MTRESRPGVEPVSSGGLPGFKRFYLGLACLGLCLSMISCSRSEDPSGTFRIDERFQIELWASEQLLNGPVAMALDEKERAFVLEMPEFPPGDPGRRQVKMLEDTNGDGLPDRAVVPSAAEVPAQLLTWQDNRNRTSDPRGNVFGTSAACHIQYLQPSGTPLSISDHGARAGLFPITEDPVYPVLTEPDRTSAPSGIVYYSNAKVAGFDHALFTAEPVHNLVHCDLLIQNGPVPVARRAGEESDFLASTDPLFRPVGFAVGSDGSLYVVDFYSKLAGPTEVLEVGVKPDGVLFQASGKGRIFKVTPRTASAIGPKTGSIGARSSDAVPPVQDSGHPMADAKRAVQSCESPSTAPLTQSLRILGITDPALSRSLLEKRILDAREPDEVQAAAVRSLGSIPGEAPALFLISNWRTMTSLPRAAAMDALFQEPARLRMLLASLEQEQIPLWCLDAEHRVRLLRHEDAVIANRTRQLLTKHDPLQDPLIRNYSAALSGKGDKAAGELVYKRLCARCHTFRGGNNYGPDLWTVSSRPRRWIMTNILLPNESMATGREMYMIDLRGGGSVDGVIGSQDPTTIRVLHDESQQETVLRQDIQQILLSDSSAMPVDLASQISVTDMADLLRFLTTR